MIENSNIVISTENENNFEIFIYIPRNKIGMKDLNQIKKISNFRLNDELVQLEINKEIGINKIDLFYKVIINFQEQQELMEPFKNFLLELNKEIENDQNPLMSIINFLKINNNANFTSEKLKGDIGEALLILKLANLGYDLQKYLRPRDEELYDFYIDNTIIEVKNSSIRSNEIKINDSQMISDSDSKNIHIIVVKTKYSKKALPNHKNILDIYEMIDQKISLHNSLLKEKKNHYETIDQQIIDNNSIDINDYSFSLMDYKKIIENKINKPSGLKDLIYIFDVSDLEKLSDQKLRELIIKND